MMKRLLVVVWAFLLLALTGTGLGSPTKPFKVQTVEVPALGGRMFSVDWEGKQRACAIALGDGSTYMGLDVYDIYGNCVAWDDEGMPQTCDDLAVEWRPRQKATFVVELHNCGLQANNCKLVLR
jgi:hypothetical protein